MKKKTNTTFLTIPIKLWICFFISAFFLFLNTTYTDLYDKCWNKTLSEISWTIIIILPYILYFFKINIKKIVLSIILTFMIIVANNFYYNNYSGKIESLIYLHNKHNFKYNDMKVIKTHKSYSTKISVSYRGATIEYKNSTIIKTEYKNEQGWTDNYLK